MTVKEYWKNKGRNLFDHLPHFDLIYQPYSVDVSRQRLESTRFMRRFSCFEVTPSLFDAAIEEFMESAADAFRTMNAAAESGDDRETTERVTTGGTTTTKTTGGGSTVVTEGGGSNVVTSGGGGKVTTEEEASSSDGKTEHFFSITASNTIEPTVVTENRSLPGRKTVTDTPTSQTVKTTPDKQTVTTTPDGQTVEVTAPEVVDKSWKGGKRWSAFAAEMERGEFLHDILQECLIYALLNGL